MREVYTAPFRAGVKAGAGGVTFCFRCQMTHILLPRDLPQDRDQMTVRLLALALLALSSVAAKQCQGEDLPSDAALRIGVKKRVPECATKASKGQQLSMHYRGYLYSSCEEFDSSYGRDEPFEFTLERLGATYVKFGQILSTRPDLVGPGVTGADYLFGLLMVTRSPECELPGHGLEHAQAVHMGEVEPHSDELS